MTWSMSAYYVLDEHKRAVVQLLVNARIHQINQPALEGARLMIEHMEQYCTSELLR
jgi:hypothetical protein